MPKKSTPHRPPLRGEGGLGEIPDQVRDEKHVLKIVYISILQMCPEYIPIINFRFLMYTVDHFLEGFLGESLYS